MSRLQHLVQQFPLIAVGCKAEFLQKFAILCNSLETRPGLKLLKLRITLRGSAPQKLMYWLCFSKRVDLAFKVFCIAMVNFALLHGY